MRAKLAGLLHEAAKAVAPKPTVPLNLVVENRHPFICPRCGVGQKIDQSYHLDLIDVFEVSCDNCSKTLRFREPWDYELEAPVTSDYEL